MGNGIEIWVYRSFSKFQIERPEQVIDFLGMMGDAADNIQDCLVWEKSQEIPKRIRIHGESFSQYRQAKRKDERE
jgi:hypothetical protein